MAEDIPLFSSESFAGRVINAAGYGWVGALPSHDELDAQQGTSSAEIWEVT